MTSEERCAALLRVADALVAAQEEIMQVRAKLRGLPTVCIRRSCGWRRGRGNRHDREHTSYVALKTCFLFLSWQLLANARVVAEASGKTTDTLFNVAIHLSDP